MADSQGATSSAIVTITITGENDAPQAADDNAATPEDAVLLGGSVLSNDLDVDAGDTKSVVAVNGQAANVGNTIVLTSGALLSMRADGNYAYDPNGKFLALAPGQTAVDSFVYTMADSQGATSSAMVAISVGGANSPPTAANDAATIGEDGLLDVACSGRAGERHRHGCRRYQGR